ncbi:hypothetical protein V8D89_000074 [Ganoderma adspersum]
MSTEPYREHEGLLDANGNPIETWGGKFERKFKENPFVPVLAGLTTVSLIIAGAKLRRRDSVSLNNWLRVRVLMQGLTVVAVVGGSWWYGQMKHQKEAAAQLASHEQDKLIERLAFEKRLRAAEEVDRLEKLEEEVLVKQVAQRGSGGSAGGWLGGWWGSGKGSGKDASA